MLPVQLLILNKILHKKDFSIVILNNLDESYFPQYKAEFLFIKNHYDTYKVVPDLVTFLSYFNDFEVTEVNEPDTFLVEELLKDYNIHVLINGINTWKKNDLDSGSPEDPYDYFNNVLSKLKRGGVMSCVDLFKNAQERYLDYESRINSFNDHYVTTGFKELDEIIGGWDREEEYALVVARTNNGKSLITLKMAIAAAQAGLTVGIYSGEMSAKKVGYRADSLISHISSGYLNHGNSIVKNEYKKFIESAPNLMSGTIKVITPADVVGEVTVNVLETFIEREHLDMLVIDQVSLLSDARKGKTPVECMSNISKDIKLLQTRKRIPIIAVSQLNRSKNDDASDDTITTSMIAQSDRLDQDATCVIGISRDKKDANLLKLQVVKSRDGQVGNKLSYSCDFGRGIFTYIPEEKDNKSSSQDNLKEADDDYEARYTRTDQAGENIF